MSLLSRIKEKIERGYIKGYNMDDEAEVAAFEAKVEGVLESMTVKEFLEMLEWMEEEIGK